MIERILPGPVRWSEAWDDDLTHDLLPEEEPYVARTVDKRRAEFATVRRCAREALVQLGHPPGPVPPGEQGAPRWPAGVVGSMTHCDRYRAAALARAGDVVSIGIDAEPCDPLPDGVLAVVATPEEQQALAALPSGVVAWDRVLFSAKESVYKAWFPLTGTFLDFQEAAVAVRPDGTFSARLLVDGPLVGGRRRPTFTGRWRVERGVVVTAVVLVPAES